MKVTKKSGAINKTHEDGPDISYYISKEYEVHYGEKKEKMIDPGAVVQIEDTPHIFSNLYKKVCKMVTFRFVPKGEDQHETIKNDKVLHPEAD